jgi:DNA replication protein DnaC
MRQRVEQKLKAMKHKGSIFEVITRRYEALKPIVLTSNKPFSEWPDVFAHAARSVFDAMRRGVIRDRDGIVSCWL